MTLPDDFIAFLNSGEPLSFDPTKCETGIVEFHTLSALSVVTFNLQTYATPLEGDDPNAGKYGYYAVPSVSLLASCQNYDPNFHLVWLPEEGMFGSGDGEHGHLIVFPHASWSEILANPVPYLEAQWNEGGTFGEYLLPWSKYPFVSLD